MANPALRSAIGLLMLAAAAACSGGPSDTAQQSLVPTQLELSSVRRLANYAMRPQWSFDGQWVVFDRPISGKWQVHRVRADGTGEECLTCGQAAHPGHNGGPHLSPDGRFVIFSAEKATHPPIPPGSTLTDPGAGIYNDIAVIEISTRAITRLTDVSVVPSAAGGSMHPRFAYDGKKVMWSDFEGAGSELGNYQINVADFDASTGTPRLTNVRSYNPGEKSEMAEAQGFSPDGERFYYTCAPRTGQSDLAADICEFAPATGVLRRMSQTAGIDGEPAAYEEHGAINPVMPLFIYMSSGGYGIQPGQLNFLSWLRADLWLSDASGAGAQQITFFNTPGHPESVNTGRVILSKMGWDPTGLKLVASFWEVGSESSSADDIIDIRVLTFVRK